MKLALSTEQEDTITENNAPNNLFAKTALILERTELSLANAGLKTTTNTTTPTLTDMYQEKNL